MQKQEKILWFDSETGGVESKTDALIQLSAIIEINGKIVDEIDLKMKPLPKKLIHPKAIATHGMTLQDIAGFEDPYVAYRKFYAFLAGHGPKAKEDRYIMAGYKSEFDCNFVYQFFADINGITSSERYNPYWDYCQFKPIDCLSFVVAMHKAKLFEAENDKLGTICKVFGIEIKAHDALSDIRATRELTHKILGRLFTGWKGEAWGLLGPVNGVENLLL